MTSKDTVRTGHCPEYEVLSGVVGLATTADAVDRLRVALAQVTDWGDLLRMARRHGVFPSLYRRMAAVCPDAVTPEFLAELQKLYRAHIRRNLRMTADLLRILHLFASHEIHAIPYKGPVLAAVAFEDIALRQFTDLDLLVSPKDLMRVKDLLFGEGYRLCDALTPRQERAHLRHTCEYTFEHPRRPLLDIHWRLAPRYLGGGPDPEMMLQRSVPVSLEGCSVSSLAPEDMLLMLCLHGALHLWTTLDLVCDVARLVQAQNQWDWPSLMARAEGLGMRRMLLLGLYLAARLLGATVPREMMAQAETDPAVLALCHKVRERQVTKWDVEPSFFEMGWFGVKVKERLGDKFTYFWVRAMLPTVADWEWVRFPDSFFWLYFCLRPLRLMAQGVIIPTWQRLSKVYGRFWQLIFRSAA